MSLVKQWLVRKTQKNGITSFFVRDVQDLSKQIEKRIENLEYIQKNKSRVIDTIQAIQQEKANVPRITIYDNSEWVWSVFDDIYRTIRAQWLIMIRMFASNTYMERNENPDAEKTARTFFERMEREKIGVEVLVGSGNLIMERIETGFKLTDAYGLPASQSSINIIVVGKIVYLILFDRVPQGVKIENEYFADVMHLLFDVVGKKKD